MNWPYIQREHAPLGRKLKEAGAKEQRDAVRILYYPQEMLWWPRDSEAVVPLLRLSA